MDRAERATELLQEAEEIGVHVEFDCGLILAKMAKGDREKQLAIVEEISKLSREVRRLARQRAIATRAKELLGRPIWMPEYRQQGKLVGADDDGGLVVSIDKAGLRSSKAAAIDLMVLVEEEAEVVASDPDPPSQKPRRWFGLL